MRGRALAVGAVERARPVRVQPLEVHRIDRVLLALEPVAGDLGEHDLHEAVRPGEGLPGRHQRRRRRPEIRPEQSGLHLDRISLDAHAILELRLWVRGLLERLLKAAARVVPEPAVVVAAQAAAVDPAIRQVGAAMRAVAVDQAVVPSLVLVENEVLAHEPYGLGGTLVELGDGGNRHPVAPEQLAHRRAGADFRQSPVLLLAEHGPILLPVGEHQGRSALPSADGSATPRRCARVGAMSRMSMSPSERPAGTPGPTTKNAARSSGRSGRWPCVPAGRFVFVAIAPVYPEPTNQPGLQPIRNDAVG